MSRKAIKYEPQPNCPHCGGLHLGQRFDNCPYVKLITDEQASEEQKQNAREWLLLNQSNSAPTAATGSKEG